MVVALQLTGNRIKSVHSLLVQGFPQSLQQAKTFFVLLYKLSVHSCLCLHVNARCCSKIKWLVAPLNHIFGSCSCQLQGFCKTLLFAHQLCSPDAVSVMRLWVTQLALNHGPKLGYRPTVLSTPLQEEKSAATTVQWSIVSVYISTYPCLLWAVPDIQIRYHKPTNCT